MKLEPNYIIDDYNQKIAVQLSIDTYKNIVQVLEDYALFKMIEENQNDDVLSLDDAREYYQSLRS